MLKTFHKKEEEKTGEEQKLSEKGIHFNIYTACS